MDPDVVFLFAMLIFAMVLAVGALIRCDGLQERLVALEELSHDHFDDDDDDFDDDDTDLYDECEDCICDCMAPDDVRAVFDEPESIDLRVNGESLGEFETVGEAAHALAFHWADNRKDFQVAPAEACTNEPPAVALEPAGGPFGCDFRPISVIAVCGACDEKIRSYELN